MLCFLNPLQSYGIWKNCPSKTINNGKYFYRQHFVKKYCIVKDANYLMLFGNESWKIGA